MSAGKELIAGVDLAARHLSPFKLPVCASDVSSLLGHTNVAWRFWLGQRKMLGPALNCRFRQT